MFVFAAGFAELIILLIMLVGPLIKAFFDYLAEQKKRQDAKKLGVKIVQAAQENNEEIILAESAEISYDLAERKPPKEKRTPKIRSKSNRKKAEQAVDAVFETSAAPAVAPVVAATVSSATPYEMTPPQQESANDDSLAAVIFKMFQSPTGVQQAILVSEILKRPNVGTTGPGSVHNF